MSASNPIETFIRCIALRLRAEKEEARCWILFREAAMKDPSVTLEMCDRAWMALVEKARGVVSAEDATVPPGVKP